MFGGGDAIGSCAAAAAVKAKSRAAVRTVRFKNAIVTSRLKFSPDRFAV
jgi:hypothetical protein